MLFIFSLARDVLDGIDDVLRLSALPFCYALTVVFPPVRLFGGTVVVLYLYLEVVCLSIYQLHVHLVQVLTLARFHVGQELAGGHALFRHQLAILVLEHAGLQVPFYDIVVTHVQCLAHHIVCVSNVSDSVLDTAAGEENQQRHHRGHSHQTDDKQQRNWRGIVMDALRMEPFVVDALQLSCFLKTGILVINEVDDVLVVTHNVQLAGRNVNILKYQAVEAQFLNLIA